MSCAGGSRRKKRLGLHLAFHLKNLVPVGREVAVALLLLQLSEARSAKWGGGGEGVKGKKSAYGV